MPTSLLYIFQVEYQYWFYNLSWLSFTQEITVTMLWIKKNSATWSNIKLKFISFYFQVSFRHLGVHRNMQFNVVFLTGRVVQSIMQKNKLQSIQTAVYQYRILVWYPFNNNTEIIMSANRTTALNLYLFT